MASVTVVLVTGTEGYLGSLLAPELVRQGYEVIGLDTGFYKERMLYRDGGMTPLTLAKDLRQIEAGRPGGGGRGRSHGRAVERSGRSTGATHHL